MNAWLFPSPVSVALLENDGVPLERTLCGTEPVPTHVQVTAVPETIVGVPGLKKSLPTVIARTPTGGVVAVAAKAIGEPTSPGLAACADCAPIALPSVQLPEATPKLLESVVAAAIVPPPATTVHATDVPVTGLPNWSLTRTPSGVVSGVLTVPDWALPPASAMVAAAPAVAVAVNNTGDPVAPVTVAVAFFGPAFCAKVQVVEASPCASVTLVGGLTDAPVPEVLHVTVTPAAA